MSWNYRVIKKTTQLGDYLAVHDVYYENDKITMWSEDQTEPSGETIEDLKIDLQRYLVACDKPILIEKDDTLVEIEETQ